MAIFFIDLNKLKEYNENMLQVERNVMKNTIEQYGYVNTERYGAERSEDDYIS